MWWTHLWHVYCCVLQARSLIATSETNCIVDFMDESLDIAESLRSVPASNRGPLFGMPISVKECFFVKGYDSTAGNAFSSFAVWPDWAFYWTLANFLKPLATINLPKSLTFLGNFCIGVKSYHFSSEIIFGQLLKTFSDFFLVTLMICLYLGRLYSCIAVIKIAKGHLGSIGW